MLFSIENQFYVNAITFHCVQRQGFKACAVLFPLLGMTWVFYFNRDECWACLSVHFYNPQFTSGNEETLFYDVSSTFINKRIERK